MIILLNYKHIIWDWNGTLLDDVDLCVSIMCGILRKRNLPIISKDYYRKIFTFPVIEYYERTGLDLSIHKFEDLSVEFIEHYERNRLNCKLYDGTEILLRKISETGISQSILSAYSLSSLEEIVKHFGIEKYFEKLNGLSNIYAASKIETGKKYMSELYFENHEVLLIGDSVHDFEVGREIGADVILISQGHQSKEILLSCGVPVYDDLKQLIKVFS